MFCGNCGQKIPDDSRFCEQCGKSVASHRPPPPAGTGTGTGGGRFISGLFRKPAMPGQSPEYSRIIFWINDRYGNRFSPGMNDDDVQRQIEAVYQSERGRGVPVGKLEGFSAFVSDQKNRILLLGKR